MLHKILAINPGSTSTKIGVYEEDKQIFNNTLRHQLEEIEKYDSIYDQLNFRKAAIMQTLQDNGIELGAIKAVVGRGGLLKPIEGGTYWVNEKMLQDLKAGIQGQHASNLGGIIAHEISKIFNIPALIVDPVVVDEMDEVARISGIPDIERKSIFHALNQKAVAKRYAKEIDRKYEELRLIVAHMGGGISIGVHKDGRVIDVNNALDGEGPFSPERSGALPCGDLIRMCCDEKYSCKEIRKKINGSGGISAYLQTNDVREVIAKAEEGDKKSKLIFEAFVYQIAKEIGSCATVLLGNVDAIILTGGIAFGKSVTEAITERVKFIAPIVIYPGEDELLALAQGGLRILKGEEAAKEYL